VSDIRDSLPRDLAVLARGAANAGIEGLDSEQDVVEVALRLFFEEHDDVRHAAVAERYESIQTMTRGRAADLADLQPGPEVKDMLRDHGVKPYREPGHLDDEE